MILNKITTSFSKGLNQAATHTIQNDECSIAENFVFKDRAAVVRQGYTIHANVCSSEIKAIEKFYQPDGDSYFTAIAEGKVWYSVTSGDFTSISSEPISGDVRKSVFDGALYLTDYDSSVKYFNGGQVGIAGLSSPQFKKVLSDCEDPSRWLPLDSNGDCIEDTLYMHREVGDSAISITASNMSSLHVRQFFVGNNSVNSRVENIAANAQETKNSMCMDTSGNIHVIGNKTSGTTFGINGLMHYYSQNYGSTWTTIHALSGAVRTGGQIHPNYSGGIKMVYSTSSNFNCEVYSVANWTYQSGWIPQNRTSGLNTSAVMNVFPPIYSTDIDSSGNIHLAAKIAASVRDVMYAKYISDTGLWTALSGVGTSGLESESQWADHSRNSIDIRVDTSNNPLIAFGGYNLLNGNQEHYFVGFIHGASGIIDTSSIFSSSWPYTAPLSSYVPTSVAVCTDASANAHVVWQYNNGSFSLSHKVKYNGSSDWSVEKQVHQHSNGFQVNGGIGLLVNSSSQRLHSIWRGSVKSKYYLRHASFLSGTWSQTDDNFYSLDPSVGRYKPICTVDGVNTSNNDRTLDGWNALYWGSGYTLNYTANVDNKYFNQPSPTKFDLTVFAPGVSSSGEDLIQLFVVANKRENIANCWLRFYDGLNYAVANLTSTSAWRSVSTHEYGLSIAVPKSNFSGASLNWAACDMQIALQPSSGASVGCLAKVAIDNVRMLKTPPIPYSRVITSARPDIQFWGSSFQTTRTSKNGSAIRRFVDRKLGRETTSSWIVSEPDTLQLEGLRQITDPLPQGTYYYKTTFVKESPTGFEIESNPSQPTSGYMVSSNSSSWTYINLNNFPIAPSEFNATARRVYRRNTNDPVYRFVYTIADNEEVEFNDTVPQAALGWVLEEDHNPPPASKFIFRGSDQRMYYFNIQEFGEKYPSRLRASKPYEPYYVPEDAIDVSPDDGTEGTGIFEYQGVVHLLKERSTWSLQQGLVCNNQGIGCISPDSIAVGKNEVFWLSDQGPIMYNLRFHNIGHSVDGASRYRIQTILDRLPKDYYKNAKGTYYNGYYLLAVTDSGSTVNNLVLCYDVDNDAWTTFPNMQVACWTVWNGFKDGYRLFFGNYSGQICEMFTGNYDVSTPISYRIKSREFGTPQPEYFVRKAYTFMENLDSNLKTVWLQPHYDFTKVSSDADSMVMSGPFVYNKAIFPQGQSPSYFALEVNGSGRIRINSANIYFKEEKLR